MLNVWDFLVIIYRIYDYSTGILPGGKFGGHFRDPFSLTLNSGTTKTVKKRTYFFIGADFYFSQRKKLKAKQKSRRGRKKAPPNAVVVLIVSLHSRMEKERTRRGRVPVASDWRFGPAGTGEKRKPHAPFVRRFCLHSRYC